MEKIDDSFIINKPLKLTTDWNQMTFYEGSFVSSSNWDGGEVDDAFLTDNTFAQLRGGGRCFFHLWINPLGACCIYCVPNGINNMGDDWCQVILQTEDYGNWELASKFAMNGTQFCSSLDQNKFQWLSTPGLTGHIKVTYYHSGRPAWVARELDDELQPIEET